MNGKIPERNCDVIMKGGITSGVVYPLAMAELAEEFRFRNIGGTSAGAIAAAVTAAAELRRVSEHGSNAGFDELRKLPDFLAGSTGGQPNLLNLFPPAQSTRKLFSVLTSFLGDAPFGEKAMNALAALLVASPLITILSFLPALLLPLALRAQMLEGPIARLTLVGVILAELVLVATSVLLMILGNLAVAFASTLPRNRFGFSTGRAPADSALPGVSDWLHRELQKLSGLPLDKPLTFGDLWLAGVPIENREEQLRAAGTDSDLRSINLQMIATALSHGQPYRLPFENRIFAFRASEMREYFSDEVVHHMIAASPQREDLDRTTDPDLYALPEPWDLPVVVAARMSLSFPLLFAMVPLYAVDYTFPSNNDGSAKKFERCWFIDGGLSSNFPITLFDSPFPRWPTFAINLKEFHPAYPKDPVNESNNVWMIRGAGNGTTGQWTRFAETGSGAMSGWVAAMLDAIRNWHDNTQSAVPGYRDRIVHVKLSPDEGGLNLNMEAKKVRSLSERGRWAGVRLRERFGTQGASSEGLNWNSHRWTRYRTSMALMQKAMRQMERAFHYRDTAYPDYDALLARTSDTNPRTGYWWPRAHNDFRSMTTEFLKLAARLQPPAVDFDENSPRPRPEMRVAPRL